MLALFSKELIRSFQRQYKYHHVSSGHAFADTVDDWSLDASWCCSGKYSAAHR